MIRDILKDFPDLVTRFQRLPPRQQKIFLNFCEAMKNQEFVAKLDALTPDRKNLTAARYHHCSYGRNERPA